MCSPNISSRSRRKFPNPCATSRYGPSKRLLSGLALTLTAFLGGWAPASAQVERRQLPMLQGETPAQTEQVPATLAPAPPPVWDPRSETYAPALPEGPPAGQDESALPPALWRGLEGSALTRLLAQVPIPSASPALAGLLAPALTTNPEGTGGETAMRVAALEWAGRVNELIEMLQSPAQAVEPGIAAPHAMALL